jgi:small GTP-binding protein
MQTVKMVVTGPFSAGKTSFIGSVSEVDVVQTERRISDGNRAVKENTTVAMDYGRISIDDDLVLYLFGTPGQKRFDFMWEILSEGMLGFVVLVDSAHPETFREARRILDTFRSYSATPFVVAANKQDDEDAWEPDDLRIAMDLGADVRVVPCIATERKSVKNVLIELLTEILEEQPEEKPGSKRKSYRKGNVHDG